MTLFNRTLHLKRRERIAQTFDDVAFLKAEIAEQLADRLLDIDRSFPLGLELGCHTGQTAKALPKGKVGRLIQADFAQSMAQDAVVDEEFIPFADQSLDVILSNLSLHWVNDLPGTLIQCRRALKEDGLLMVAMPGPRTLQELREAMMQVATETGKATPRIAPFVEVRDAGALLQRAGFALPVVDTEFLHLTYRDFPTLLRELKMMGETNALTEQFKGMTTARYWEAVEKAYVKQEGLYPVTVEIVFITAWTPHESQQQPLRRGSGKVSLKEALR